jgi:hypothetical protein
MSVTLMDEIKTKLAECNVLLKYMTFLQNNGLSDCGKGQIIGQASLLQEYIKKEQENENSNSSLSQKFHKDIEQTEKDRSIIKINTNEALVQPVRKNTFIHKTGLLREVGNMIDKAKDIKI